jgi:hypothetical protein
MEPAAPLLHFLRTNFELQSVTLNGSHYASRNRTCRYLSEPILRAVVENPHNLLVELNLLDCSNVSIETLCAFLKATTSLKLFRVFVNDHYDSVSLELLPSALAEKRTLEGVILVPSDSLLCETVTIASASKPLPFESWR